MQELKEKLNQYDEAYFHKEPLVDDQTYENLVREYELLYGPYEPNATKAIHSKTKLPIYSPSLEKIKLVKDFNLYRQNHPGPYVVMDKLDGFGLIIEYNKIYTHSTDGIYGSDLTHLLPYLTIPQVENIIVRGELVMTTKIFKEKYSTKKNERNILSAINATKNINYDLIKDLTFFAHEIQSSNKNLLDQLCELKELGFTVVPYKVQDDIDFEELTNDMKIDTECLRDGKVISSLEIERVTEGLPKHKIAFKTIGDIVESTVKSVEWNISAHMRLKPRINIEEIFLEGGNINWVNGIHAKFIIDNNIGPGSKLMISRDITPKIYAVIEGTTASLPEAYEWDATQTNFIGVIDDNVKIKRIYRFFDLMEAKHLGLKTIEKLYLNFKSIQSILDATLEQLIKIPGIKTKGAERILKAIQDCCSNVTLVKVMTASCLFPNFAEKKLQQIICSIPSITNMLLDLSVNEMTIEHIQKVPGIKDTAEIFIDNIDNFKEFLNDMPTIKALLIKQEEKDNLIDMNDIDDNDDNNEYHTPPLIIEEQKPQILEGMVIVFSGDKKCTATARTLGAMVDSNVTKRTTLLIVDQIGSMNKKERDCIKNKIPIMSLKDFKEQYLNNDSMNKY